jgi:vancomycin resistance protein YoaR
MIANKKAIRSNILKIIIAFFAVVFLSTAGACLWFYSQVKKYENKVYPGVYIDNVNFGGKTKTEVEEYYKKKNKGLEKVAFSIVYEKSQTTGFSAGKLKLGYDGAEAAEKAFLVGRSPRLPSLVYQRITLLLNLDSFNVASQIAYDKTVVREQVINLEEKYNHPAVNARFKFENGKVASFRKEEKGLKVDVDKTMADFDKEIRSLKNKVEPKKINLAYKIIEPEITLSKANKFGIEEFIAEGKSDFSHSIAERIHNIIVASSKLNGLLIPKDKIFSFNDNVGDISAQTGYKPAYIIKEGKTVLGDGGGVCQVSTTLFRAALNAGLPIVERHAHAYRVSYYESDSKPGLDATVFSPTADLKFKNDTPAYILIQTEVDQENNLLYFRFYGKKDNRKIEMSEVSVYDVQPPPPATYEDDPTLKKGVVKQIDFPAWGAKANFNYKVTNENKITFEKTFYSVYRPWQAVFLKGIAD